MTAVPSTLPEWLIGGPWVKAPYPKFHDYWMEVHTGKREADSYLVFGDGGLHELCHMVTCKDEDLLDPYWGCGPIGNPYSEIVDPIEFETSHIDLILWGHFNRVQLPKLPGDFMLAAHSLVGKRPNYPTFLSTLPYYKSALAKWPGIDTVWDEVQRKYSVLARVL